MKYLPQFEYVVPGTLGELCKFLHEHRDRSRILAGGTDLLLELERSETAPGFVVDITRIAELSGLRDEGSHLFIGATTTHTNLGENRRVRQEALFLSEAAGSIGAVQIRNAGTIGGNIVNASPAADTIPPLIALDAQALVVNHKGENQLPLASLFSAPYKTALSRQEVLVGVRFAKLPPGAGTSFVKLGRRRAMSISRISVAVALVLGMDQRVTDTRICPGAVMPVPSRIVPAERGLIGGLPGPDLFEEAGERVAREILRVTGKRPSTPYKEPVIKNLVQRALAIAAERCVSK